MKNDIDKPFCVYVDPYFGSEDICNEFLKNGFSLLAVLTDRVPLSQEEKLQRLPVGKFAAIHNLSNEDDDSLLMQLKQIPIHYVIGGFENSLDISDYLGHHLCPERANPNRSSAWRTDKFLMNEQLAKNNIPCVKQIKTASAHLTPSQLESLQQWTFPVVVKPCKGYASFSVLFCQDLAQLQNDLNYLIQSAGGRFKEFVIQECLFGEEYFIDTVSWQGKHWPISAHHYNKMLVDNHPFYRLADIVDLQDPTISPGIDYIKHVLDAVELRFGFAHTELFLTAKGPRLIEVNPRVSGAYGFANKLARIAMDCTQAEILAKTVNSPDFFQHLYASKYPKLKCHGRVLYLQNWQPKIINPPAIEKITNLPSFKEYYMTKKPGVFLNKPVNLLDTVMLILLAHEDQEQIEKDSNIIFEYERTGELF
jgi:hypothetical protein